MKIDEIKKDFPILARKINGKRLVYLDNAATSQKPKQVIEAMVEYYQNHNANVHRGIHTLGDESTRVFHEAKEKVATFLGAKSNELVWVRNTTEAINLVAYAWARENLKTGEVIVTSELEHHSNLVTWQEVAKATGAGVVYVSVNDQGEIDIEELAMLLDEIGDQVRLVALTMVSNATGAELPTEEVIEIVKKRAKGARVLLDGAQAVPHKRVEFDRLGADFLAFSGHKMYGPMGIGGLLVKQERFEEMGPFLVGGGMIDEVHLLGTSFGEVPEKYEAGTPDVAGAVGLAAAVEYLEKLDMNEVERHDREMVAYGLERLGKVNEVKLVGPNADKRLGSVAFTYEGVHAHDVAQVLDSQGVAVRSGHHCTMPFHEKMKLVATTRASFGIYNDKEDVDALVEALGKVKQVFR